ncbi:hypothetical protein Taro_017268, partial [Colocasia esculenta]|nr:hypothetical protein [Colocasia esculenta]
IAVGALEAEEEEFWTRRARGEGLDQRGDLLFSSPTRFLEPVSDDQQGNADEDETASLHGRVDIFLSAWSIPIQPSYSRPGPPFRQCQVTLNMQSCSADMTNPILDMRQ